jgi:hypothetical protein
MAHTVILAEAVALPADLVFLLLLMAVVALGALVVLAAFHALAGVRTAQGSRRWRRVSIGLAVFWALVTVAHTIWVWVRAGQLAGSGAWGYLVVLGIAYAAGYRRGRPRPQGERHDAGALPPPLR